jgi:hypothetical protein
MPDQRNLRPPPSLCGQVNVDNGQTNYFFTLANLLQSSAYAIHMLGLSMSWESVADRVYDLHLDGDGRVVCMVLVGGRDSESRAGVFSLLLGKWEMGRGREEQQMSRCARWIGLRAVCAHSRSCCGGSFPASLFLSLPPIRQLSGGDMIPFLHGTKLALPLEDAPEIARLEAEDISSLFSSARSHLLSIFSPRPPRPLAVRSSKHWLAEPSLLLLPSPLSTPERGVRPLVNRCWD